MLGKRDRGMTMEREGAKAGRGRIKGRKGRATGALLRLGLALLVFAGAFMLIFASNGKPKLDPGQTPGAWSSPTDTGHSPAGAASVSNTDVSNSDRDQDNGPGSARVVRVVATIFPLADIARQIGGNRVVVATLLPPGASPHTFELTPRQAREMATADVLIRVGSSLDDWAMRGQEDGRRPPRESSRGPAPVIVVLTGASSASGDPHIWLDPVRVKDEIAPRIAEALADVAPDARGSFESNLRQYQGKLQDLHVHISQVVKKCRTRRYISFHSAWRHFSARYGLVEAASIEEFPGKEPSAGWIADVVDLARRNGIKVIFAEPQFSPKVARTIAGEIGGEVLLLDPLGGEGIRGRDSYLGLMEYNLSIFKEALQ